MLRIERYYLIVVYWVCVSGKRIISDLQKSDLDKKILSVKA